MQACANALPEALAASGPAADRGGNMDLYGWLIGSWDLDVTEIDENSATRRRPGEWHFGWALEGRAIQDVWIVPPRGSREHEDAAANRNYYGTTLRVYDPRIDAWHIQWTDPVSQIYLTMTGRRQGADIVQLGTGFGGLHVRWSFSEISRDSFRWRSELSSDGESWRMNTEFFARRGRPAAAARRSCARG